MKLEKGAMIFVFALVSVSTTFFTGDACDNVPSMAMDVACPKACNTQPLYQLCQTTLRNAAPTGEVTTYAFAAATSTMAVADRLLQNPSLPDGERAAYASCKDKYDKAHSLMDGVMNQLFACAFEYARQEYVDAMVAVGSCGDGLWAFQSSPQCDMNAADQNNTMIAYDLGALIVGK